MQRLSWVKWYMTDWMFSVRRMSWSARGIYMEALGLQFHNERLGDGYETWQEMFPGITERDYQQVVQHFQVREDEQGKHLVNCRLEAEMEASKVKSDKARANARLKHSGRRADAERTQSERSAIRGEERREEENREEEKVAGVAPRKRRAPDPLRWDLAEGFVGYTPDDVERWRKAYPSVDIEGDILRCSEHLRSRPDKWSTKNWRKRLVAWFARSQGYAKEAQAKAKAGRQRDESHIPADCHPEDRWMFFTPDGKPRMPPTWRNVAGEYVH